jgi:uncharacterized protein YjbJ (UPF0337 family)
MNNLETKIDTSQINSKKNAVKGTLNQAKGVARETLGQVTNDRMMQLAGKKDQVVGALQKNVGDSWVYRKKNVVFLMSVAAVVAAAVFYFVNRTNETMTAENQNTPSYTY